MVKLNVSILKRLKIMVFWQNAFFPYLNPTSYLNGKLHFLGSYSLLPSLAIRHVWLHCEISCKKTCGGSSFTNWSKVHLILSSKTFNEICVVLDSAAAFWNILFLNLQLEKINWLLWMYPANICLLKFNTRNTSKKCEIC